MEELNEKINQVLNIRLSLNRRIESPIADSTVVNFEKRYHKTFGIEIDREIIFFYKICDGLEYNEYQIYSSYDHVINGVEYGIFQNNELWYEQDEEDNKYIFYAESGSELFVFNKEQEEYQCLDRYNTDNIIATFSSFNDMLLYILKLMLYEEVD